MKNAIKAGLETDGIIPGRLKLQRKAKRVYEID